MSGIAIDLIDNVRKKAHDIRVKEKLWLCRNYCSTGVNLALIQRKEIRKSIDFWRPICSNIHSLKHMFGISGGQIMAGRLLVDSVQRQERLSVYRHSLPYGVQAMKMMPNVLLLLSSWMAGLAVNIKADGRLLNLPRNRCRRFWLQWYQGRNVWLPICGCWWNSGAVLGQTMPRNLTGFFTNLVGGADICHSFV